MKIAIGLLLAAGIGILGRLAGIPSPAPPAIVGALLVVAMTAGFVSTGLLLQQQTANVFVID